MQAWHKIDMQIARYHVEACDNAKYLGSTEKHSHAVYLETPSMMQLPLSRLLYMVKMIYNVSSYFNNSVRVASFLVKITFQAIISCKNYLTNNGTKNIWNQDVEVIKKKIHECIELKDSYVASYVKVRDGRLRGGEVQKFEFSQQYIFGNFDTCSKVLY